MIPGWTTHSSSAVGFKVKSIDTALFTSSSKTVMFGVTDAVALVTEDEFTVAFTGSHDQPIYGSRMAGGEARRAESAG